MIIHPRIYWISWTITQDPYNEFKLDLGWARDSRNRIVFPDRGSLNRISGEFAMPFSSLDYYKIKYNNFNYITLYKPMVFAIGGEIGYGNGYGKTGELPFFENFFAGGIGSVRGYKSNTIGCSYRSLSSNCQGEIYEGDNDDRYPRDARGGRFKTTGTVELLFPAPFLQDFE